MSGFGLCIGTAFRSQENEEVCVRVIEHALDRGCNFIDTALYGEGISEKVVGRVLKARRQDVVLTTKIFKTLGGNQCGSIESYQYYEWCRS